MKEPFLTDGEKPLPVKLTHSKPEIKFDKNNQTISVPSAFDSDTIPIKIIASCKTWAQWLTEYEENNCFICPASTFLHVSILRKKDKESFERLIAYSKDDPHGFMMDFYAYYLSKANANYFEYNDPEWLKQRLKNTNPLIVKKPRGVNPHDLDHWQMSEIKRTAR